MQMKMHRHLGQRGHRFSVRFSSRTLDFVIAPAGYQNFFTLAVSATTPPRLAPFICHFRRPIQAGLLWFLQQLYFRKSSLL